MAVTLVCAYCGSEFQVDPYRRDTAKFCSQKCMGLYGHHVGGYFKCDDHSHSKGNTHRQGICPTNAFPSGHTPWNKGVNVHLSPATEFQPGNKPANALLVDATTIRTRRGKQRRWVKVAEPNVWRPCACVVWENTHGPIPPGSVIHHRDQNTLNDDLGNLQCLSRKEHLAVHRAG